VQGAQRALQTGEIPAGITRQALMVYREIAKRQIARELDNNGVQALRVKVIEEVLKKIN
jgi:hypothetical protein